MNPGSHRRGLVIALALITLLTGLTLSTSSAAVKPRKKKTAPKAISACAHRVTGQLRLRTKRRCRKSERLLMWSVRGPRGKRGRRGVAGKAGAGAPGGETGPGGTTPSRSIFTARAGGYVPAINPAYAAVTGPTTVTATESLVQSLAPTAGFVAGGLAVRATDAPGAGNSITVVLRDDGADTTLGCTISGASTTCSSDATTSIAGASAMSLEVSSSGAVPTTSLLVGFEAG